MTLKDISLFLLLISVLSCNNIKDETSNKSTRSVDLTQRMELLKIQALEPDMWKADSAQVLYYDDPDGDSLRYSRFFTFTEIGDSAKVDGLLHELDQSFTKHNSKRDCRSEGKLYLLNKEDVLKTIYFSTRGDSCSYMYFIKDGSFIYFSMSDRAKKFFVENKRLAKKPLDKL
jgi:hypothetical protein